MLWGGPLVAWSPAFDERWDVELPAKLLLLLLLIVVLVGAVFGVGVVVVIVVVVEGVNGKGYNTSSTSRFGTMLPPPGDITEICPPLLFNSFSDPSPPPPPPFNCFVTGEPPRYPDPCFVTLYVA
jgi:hypothetical protein